MQNKLRKQLLKEINEFLDKLEYYVDDCNEFEMTKLIAINEITRFFKNLEYCKKDIDKRK